MKSIYILWASVRPQMLHDTYLEWISKCVGVENVYWKIAVLTDEQKNEIDSFNFPNFDVQIVNEKRGYNFAITHLTKQIEVNDDDILLLLSDDFSCPDNWDDFIYKKFENWNGAIFLDDGYQNANAKVGQLCITLACMTFECLKKLNKIVFNPAYNHYFSDNEAYMNLNALGLLIDNRDTDHMVFMHNNYVRHLREQDEYDKNNFSYWTEDHITYQARVTMSIEERLK